MVETVYMHGHGLLVLELEDKTRRFANFAIAFSTHRNFWPVFTPSVTIVLSNGRPTDPRTS